MILLRSLQRAAHLRQEVRLAALQFEGRTRARLRGAHQLDQHVVLALL